MHSFPASASPRGRVLLFVPKWRPETEFPQGTPVQAIPVVGALVRNGYAVDLIIEELDGLDSDAVRRSLDTASVAAVWSNAFDAAEQIPSMQRFFALAKEMQPEARRVAGGGFLVTLPPSFDLGEIAEKVAGADPWALVDHLGPCTDRTFTADTLLHLDATRFLAPSPLRFGNDDPALALPTGTGCGRACPFCVHENSPQHLLPAADVADAMVHAYHRAGVRQFTLSEQDFFSDLPRALELARILRRKGLPLLWCVSASIPDVLQIAEEELRELAAAGLIGVEMGVEAGSDSALTKLGKGYRVVHAVRAHDRLLAHGIDPIHDMLFGWPGETARDRRATLDLVDRLNRTGRSGAFRFRRYRAVPTTSTGDSALRFGGPQPITLEGLRTLEASQRTMPWLQAAEERRVRLLTDYILPMAYRPRRTSRTLRPWRALSTLARLRCRTGLMALPVDRAIFAKSGDPAPALN